MIATTIISSMRVKPRWFATVSRFFVHHRIIVILLLFFPLRESPFDSCTRSKCSFGAMRIFEKTTAFSGT
jgi:hypothetical protein